MMTWFLASRLIFKWIHSPNVELRAQTFPIWLVHGFFLCYNHIRFSRLSSPALADTAGNRRSNSHALLKFLLVILSDLKETLPSGR